MDAILSGVTHDRAKRLLEPEKVACKLGLKEMRYPRQNVRKLLIMSCTTVVVIAITNGRNKTNSQIDKPLYKSILPDFAAVN